MIDLVTAPAASRGGTAPSRAGAGCPPTAGAGAATLFAAVRSSSTALVASSDASCQRDAVPKKSPYRLSPLRQNPHILVYCCVVVCCARRSSPMSPGRADCRFRVLHSFEYALSAAASANERSGDDRHCATVLLGSPDCESPGWQQGCAGVRQASSKGYSSEGGCCPVSSVRRQLRRLSDRAPAYAAAPSERLQRKRTTAGAERREGECKRTPAHR